MLGLFTRYAALQAALFLAVACFERWRVGGWFWNKLGMEYTVLWALAAFHVLVHGGGRSSLDHILALPVLYQVDCQPSRLSCIQLWPT